MNRRRVSLAVLALGVTLSFAGGARGTDLQTKLDQLNEREKQLIEKLETARQREREIETKLEELRRHKQEILAKQTARKPGSPEASPAPTP